MRTSRRIGSARILAASVALAAASGCAAPPPFSLALSWRFADGRTCAGSGALTVAVSAGDTALGPSSGFSCPDGEGAAAVTVEVPGDASALDLQAETLAGAALYRGKLALPSPPPESATATLYFVQ
jgi:hypothetical protein